MTPIITTKRITLMLLEVDDVAYDFSFRSNNEIIALHKGIINPLTNSERSVIYVIPLTRYGVAIKDWKIVGLIKDLNSEQVKRFVEGFFKKDKSEHYDCWKNYNNPSVITYSCDSPIESFKTLLLSENIDVSKNYLLLEKLV